MTIISSHPLDSFDTYPPRRRWWQWFRRNRRFGGDADHVYRCNCGFTITSARDGDVIKYPKKPCDQHSTIALKRDQRGTLLVDFIRWPDQQ